MTAGLVAVGGPALSATINPFGAELWTLRDGEGRDLLWDGDPEWWTGRAPILFPIVGALAHDRFRYQGTEYTLPKHGFARRKPFAVIEESATSAHLRLEDDAETRAAWPFSFALDLRFTITGAALAVEATVTNRGDTPLPLSFGFHPALRWPLPGGAPAMLDYAVTFAADETAPVSRIDTAGLVARTQPTPIEHRVLRPRPAMFDDDALLFLGLASRSVTYGGETGRRIRVDFPRFPDLGVWQKPGAPYLCIEPWQGHADPATFAGDIFEKPGVVPLAAGAQWTATMTLTVEDPA